MLGKPEFGWSHVQLGDFEGSASYLTDVANDCLNAMIHSFETGFDFIVGFDAEGWTFKVISDDYCTYVIEDKDKPKLYVTEKDKKELAKEIIFDIEANFDDWSRWSYLEEFDEDGRSLKTERERLRDRLEELKKILNS